MVEFEHTHGNPHSFAFDIYIIEPGGIGRRLIHSKKKQNKGMCESPAERQELFQHIDAQLEHLQSLLKT